MHLGYMTSSHLPLTIKLCEYDFQRPSSQAAERDQRVRRMDLELQPNSLLARRQQRLCYIDDSLKLHVNR